MSQRTEKVESLVQQVAASGLLMLLEKDGVKVSVTRVDVSPDLRNANVWLGILSFSEEDREQIFQQTLAVRSQIQHQLARKITTKFVPRLTFKSDTGGEYAEHISKLLKGL